MTDIDILSKALAVFNVIATREFTLKPKQEVAVRALLEGKDVLAVLPTRYSKILIYQMFVRAKDYQINALHRRHVNLNNNTLLSSSNIGAIYAKALWMADRFAVLRILLELLMEKFFFFLIFCVVNGK